MSRHKYSTVTDSGEPVTVTMGYDRPLDFVFRDVVREDDEEGMPLYSNLDDGQAGITRQDAEYYRPILLRMGIEPPESMFVEVATDQLNREGNRNVEHDAVE